MEWVIILPLPSPSCHVYSDATGSYGCGGRKGGVDISVKPVVMAAALWEDCGRDSLFASTLVIWLSFLFFIPRLQNSLCCEVFLILLCFQESCVHVPGAMNTATDALSRDNLTLFSSLVSQVPWYPTPLPLMELLITAKPDRGSPAWTHLFGFSLARALPSPR